MGLSGQGQFKKLLQDFIDEANARKPDSYSDAPYAKLDNFKIVSDLNESDKESFITFLTSEIKSDWKKHMHNGNYRSGPWYHGLKLIENLAKHSELSLGALESLAHSLKKLRDAEMSLYIPGSGASLQVCVLACGRLVPKIFNVFRLSRFVLINSLLPITQELLK